MRRFICVAAIMAASLIGSSAVGTTGSANAQWVSWGAGPRYGYYARPYYSYRAGVPYYGYRSYYAPYTYSPYTTYYYGPSYTTPYSYYYGPGFRSSYVW